MTWLLAVVLRPLGSLLLFGSALLLARLLWPLIPSGRFRTVLYDRAIRKNHPWTFGLLGLAAIYGTVYAVYLYVR